jgi:hypothetical protein
MSKKHWPLDTNVPLRIHHQGAGKEGLVYLVGDVERTCEEFMAVLNLQQLEETRKLRRLVEQQDLPDILRRHVR